MHVYHRVEYERRFLVRDLPREKPWAVRRIVDHYIDGTRVRLRESVGMVDGAPERVMKLTQKIPQPDGAPGMQGTLTTMYLGEAEYRIFVQLPAAVIRKTRYSFPPLGVDAFEGDLKGLFIAEMEFDTEEAMQAFTPPTWLGHEISDDPRFNGGRLARLLPAEARAVLMTARNLLQGRP